MKITARPLLLAAAILIVATPLAYAQFGVAPPPSSAPTDFATEIESSIADLAMTIVAIAVGLLAAWLKKKFNIDATAALTTIAANQRGALHSAVQTAVGAAVTKFGTAIDFNPASPSGKFITQAVQASTPEAVAALNATDTWILQAAASKLALSPAVLAAGAPQATANASVPNNTGAVA